MQLQKLNTKYFYREYLEHIIDSIIDTVITRSCTRGIFDRE